MLMMEKTRYIGDYEVQGYENSNVIVSASTDKHGNIG